MRRALLFVAALALALLGPVPRADAATPVASPQVTTGDNHSCALGYDGRVWCWGRNNSGQLGNATNSGTGNPNPTPAAVSGLTDAIGIAAGGNHTCALRTGGTVSCWGINYHGQLGNATNSGNTTPNPGPLAVAGISGATQIAAGTNHACALFPGGTASCWGTNYYGQLGRVANSGTFNPNPTPAPVVGLAGATQISAGRNHTCALLSGGGVTCWGHNYYGQLGNATGNGSNTPYTTPAAVAGIAGASRIAAGGNHTCALLAGGGASCWGLNYYGQLGKAANSGTQTANPTPAGVTALAGATSLGAGVSHTCALFASGAMSCWGRNSHGQLGSATNSGTDNPNPTPVGVTGFSGAAALSGGDYHTCALLAGGTVSCWGHNYYGQLGRAANSGTNVPNVTPAAVAGLPVLNAPPNQLPYGKMILSLTDGRGYGMLAYAIDPETGGPVRMRVVIPGVVVNEYDWNYTWHDMPLYTGVNRTESLVFLAQLPPGTHEICFDALDPQGAGWTRLDCRTHTVK